MAPHSPPEAASMTMGSTSSRLRRRIYIPVVLTFAALLWFFFKKRPEVILDPTYGTLRPLGPYPTLAVATLLCGEAYDDTSYIDFTRVLTYQLLHDPATRLNNTIPFLVLVCSSLPAAHKERLRLDGATVIEATDLHLPGWIHTGVTRWKDQFLKLRLWEMVEYDRILYMDADTTLTGPIDSIFDEEIVRLPATTLTFRKEAIRADEASLPAEYLFAARSNNEFTGQREHPFPPPPTSVFSAGFWIIAPSKEMFNYLMSVTGHRRRFDPTTMEQSLLNYAFRREGAMPWIELGYHWSATWPNLKDLDGGVVSLHEKLQWEGPEELQKLWNEKKRKMDAFYGG
ncbi:glycosyltransferase family 8 protein [Hyaloscypha variabilis F]|uniref:Glycosyltransferase family 8 protein n=1 Tax=Hyaloscypha variabilis (strain UAMH 11265 / GT02V1 / F) TaxID=1149755 RepID=A0A2J6S8V8_HYAVF|nr:glycosyltransferase family 8 protein [Hyaloscypha variabilis F]